MSDFTSDFSPDRTELQIESELKHVLGDSEPTKSWGGNETVMETTGSKMAFVEKEEPGTCRTSIISGYWIVDAVCGALFITFVIQRFRGLRK